MFQKEVAERIYSPKSKKSYGRLSIMSQWLCEVRHEFDINPEAFYPPPKVTSSVVTLVAREKPLAEANKQELEKLCQAVFGQRRKMLRSSLKQLTNSPVEILEKAGINPESRPEELTITEFCALSQVLTFRPSTQ